MTTKFIEDALFCTTPLALSYTDPNQKWIIRQHLISLFQNCTYLIPSIALFTHNYGTEVKLLNAHGDLPVDPPVPVTIWVHELYPQMPPILYVNLAHCLHPIYPNHPFVDPSGAAVSSYLANWMPDRSTLSGLVRNMIRLFSMNHPFYYSDDHDRDRFSHPSLFSRQEAEDRLACSIYYDMVGIKARADEEIENLSEVQVKLRERAERVEAVIIGLDQERERLKRRVDQVCAESDRVLNWLKVYGGTNGAVLDVDDVFEPRGREAGAIVECAAADHATEDVMYALDRGVEAGVVGFGEYMKQVRWLAREQFQWRARMEKVRGLDGVV